MTELLLPFALLLGCYAWLCITETAWREHEVWMTRRALLARWEGNENER